MKVDFSELNTAQQSLKTATNELQSSISATRADLKCIVGSSSLKGNVKDAIDNKINNKELPILDDLYDVIYKTNQSFSKLIKQLQDSLSEHSNHAVINSQRLDQLSKSIDTFIEDVKNEITDINSKMEAASDAHVELKKINGDTCFNQSNEAKKILTDTKNKLSSFNTVTDNSLQDNIQRISSQVKEISDIGNLSYTDPKSLSIYKNTDYKKSIKSEHEKISRQVLEKNHHLVAGMNKNVTMDDLAYLQSQMILANKGIGKAKKFVKNIKKGLSTILLSGDSLKGKNDAVYLREFRNKNTQDIILDILGLDIKKNKHGQRQIARWYSGKNNIRYSKNKGLDDDIRKLMKNIGIDEEALLSKNEFDNLSKGMDKFKHFSKYTANGAWNGAKNAFEDGIKNISTGGFHSLVEDAKSFKSAKGLGKSIPGINLVLGAADVATKTVKNKEDAKKQGLKGSEIVQSQMTGATIDTAKNVVEGVATGAVAGAVTAGMAAFGAPAIATGAVVIGAGIFVTKGIDALDKKLKITDKAKKGCNSLIKGASKWLNSH